MLCHLLTRMKHFESYLGLICFAFIRLRGFFFFFCRHADVMHWFLSICAVEVSGGIMSG